MIKHWKKFIPLIVLELAFFVLDVTHVSASHPNFETSTPIQHIIVVMQQNHTFDNYFGTYPGSEGIPPDTCLPSSFSVSENTNTSCVSPFVIGNYPINDLSHTDAVFKAQYNGGQMDGFVAALNDRHQDGTLSMGHYDETTLAYYWNLADEYVLFDRYFISAHNGSIMNRMYWVSGLPGNGINRIPATGFEDIPTIFDALQERGISWKFYVRNYDPTLNYRSLKELDYLPPQIQWLPLLSMDRFLDDPELSSRIVDLNEYYTDLENNTLPAVSYVLLLGATEHPIADIELGERAVRTMIQTLMQSESWDSSAFLLTYDDWGDWYDHVPPPQVDQYGYGFRVPTLLVSPYARRGFVDHTQLDHTGEFHRLQNAMQKRTILYRPLTFQVHPGRRFLSLKAVQRQNLVWSLDTS
jgi:phospholipase C